jgi:hypothetical protein
MNMELLLLPLRHNGKTRARVVGCLAASAREPWFGLVAAEKLTLKSMRVLDAGEPDEVLAPHWPDAIPALGRRAHLTVYAGGAAEPLETLKL